MLFEEPQAVEVAGEPAPFVEAAGSDPGVGWSAFPSVEDAADEPLAADEPAAAAELPDDTQEGPLVAAEAGSEAVESQQNGSEPEAESELEPEPVPVGADDREPWERGFDGDAEVQPVASRGPLTRLLRRRR
jgi:hypothetical protein